jgi:hypothetical protein
MAAGPMPATSLAEPAGPPPASLAVPPAPPLAAPALLADPLLAETPATPVEGPGSVSEQPTTPHIERIMLNGK